MNWFDEYGMVHVEPQPSRSSNGILFTAEYLLLLKAQDKLSFDQINRFTETIEAHQVSEGVFAQMPWEKQDPSSHDNTTAIVSFSKLYNLRFHKQLKIWGHYSHPRDIIFYSYLRGRWHDKWSYAFLWLVSLMAIISCAKTYKVRPTPWDRVLVRLKTGEWPETRKMIHTDGKFLTWIKAPKNMPLTWWICKMILKKKFGENYLHEMFKIYFAHPEHPCRVESANL